MDLTKELLREHSKSQVNKIVKYIGLDSERFRDLVSVFLGGPYRVTQRAAWPLSQCVQKHPSLIKPHLKKILNHLNKPEQHDAVRRNTMRLLQFIEIPRRNHGQVADHCYRFLESRKEPVAVRVFSMTVLASLAKDIPEIRSDLRILIEQHLPYASPAFTSRARKVLKALNKSQTG